MEPTIAEARSAADLDAVRELLQEYIPWVLTLEEGAHDAPTFRGIDEELASLPGVYAPPGGRLLLAKHNGVAAGCVCLKPVGDATAEVKRLYVRPSKRGLNFGALLVTRLVQEAREIGYERIVLDSHRSMTKAHAIYEAAGFRQVPPPEDAPEKIKQVAIFMECDLGDGP
jgi:putative acetyltransferase